MTKGPDDGAEGPLTHELTEEADGQEESIGESFARLYADGRAYAEAEVARQRLRAGIAGAAMRDAAILGIIALMLLFAGVVALLIGLVIALSPVLGPFGATAAVVGGALILALILLLLAKARITRMKKAIQS